MEASLPTWYSNGDDISLARKTLPPPIICVLLTKIKTSYNTRRYKKIIFFNFFVWPEGISIPNPKVDSVTTAALMTNDGGLPGVSVDMHMTYMKV